MSNSEIVEVLRDALALIDQALATEPVPYRGGVGSAHWHTVDIASCRACVKRLDAVYEHLYNNVSRDDAQVPAYVVGTLDRDGWVHHGRATSSKYQLEQLIAKMGANEARREPACPASVGGAEEDV